MGLGNFTIRNYEDGESVQIRSSEIATPSPDVLEHVAHHVSEVAPVEHRLSGTGQATSGANTAVTGMTPATGERTYVSATQVANAGTSVVTVILRDGAAGSTLAYIVCPAGETVPISYPSPLELSVDTQLHFQVADSVPSPASDTSVYLSAQGYSE